MKINRSIAFFRIAIAMVIAYWPVAVTAQLDKDNYIKDWTLKGPVTDESLVPALPVTKALLATAFFDGIGRPSQQVIRQGSKETGGTAADMVSFNVYDINGREVERYLPFAANTQGGNTSVNDAGFKTSLLLQQDYFMQQTYSGQGESYFYAKSTFEPSPLNRVLKTMSAGVNWSGSSRGVEQQLYFNQTGDEVRKWSIATEPVTLGSFGTYTSGGAYTQNELYKSIIIDESGKQVIEFKDKEGRVILKKVQEGTVTDNGSGSGHANWLCTYYIYDNLGNLRCVIQPEAVKKMNGISNWDLSSYLNEQCFRYEYDERNHMILKKVPGAVTVYMIYDKRDRLVMTQDGNLATAGQWMVTLYDELNRPVQTGLWTSSGNWATHNGAAAASFGYYYPFTADLVPGTGWTMLTQTHYDDYNNRPAGLSNYLTSYNSYLAATDNTNFPYPQMPAVSNATKNMAAWTKTLILGTSDYLHAVNYYDEKGRVIQVQSTNISGGTDVVTTQYSWAGQPLVSVYKQQMAGTNPQEHIVVTKNTLDDLGRVTEIKKTVNSTINSVAVNKPEQSIVQLEYDKLGQLKNKKLAPAYNSNAGLESLAYDYNIRGWMLGMNRSYAKDATSTNYFGFDLGYDKTANGLINNQSYTAAQYNGNIAGTVWKSRGDGEKRKYDYSYDGANRLLQADFKQYSSSSFIDHPIVNFDVKMGDGVDATSAYDANGNIRQMQQWGLKLTTSEQLDNLRYTYYAGSNRLKSVTDFIPYAATQLGDFKTSGSHPQASAKSALTPGSSPASFDAITDYTYDANGNMVEDLNKGLADWSMSGSTGIQYNHLNLPVFIDATDGLAYSRNISYVYDAAGNKLQKKVYNVLGRNRVEETITTYIGPFIYQTFVKNSDPGDPDSYADVLQFINHEEGRIGFKPAAGATGASFEYDYFVKDHLGNVRMVLTEEQRQVTYPAATLENTPYNGSDALTTESLYYTIDASKIVANPTGSDTYLNNNGNPPVNNNPYSNTGVTTTKVYNTNAATNKIGLGITLKVMAGDVINIYGKSYHKKPTGGSYTNPISALSVIDIINSFTSSSIMTGKGIAGSAITGASGFPTSVPSLIGTQPAQTTELPRASINWIILDEQFKYVNGGFDMANGTSGTVKSHTISTIPSISIPKNGYIYVYVSNESQYDVFFDNLQVIHTPGPILEETHYYPFGLTMAGISSKAAGSLENKRKWNAGSELNTDFDINLYETFYRSLDPQIGRFWQVDPKPREYESPYVSMGNNPISNVDPLGDYFFGLFGSTSEQRRAARAFAKQTGGDVKNITSKNVSVEFSFQAGEGILNIGIAETKFSRNGAPEILGKEVESQYDALKNGWGRIDPLTGKFERILANGKAEMVDDPITILGPGLIKGLFTKLLGSAIIKKTSLDIVEEAAEAASVLSKGDLLRIENAATRINKPISVVGSRAKGTAGAYSDWDYVIEGLNNSSWKKIKNSLPGSKSVLDNVPRNIDIFKTLDPTRPHITINPR